MKFFSKNNIKLLIGRRLLAVAIRLVLLIDFLVTAGYCIYGYSLDGPMCLWSFWPKLFLAIFLTSAAPGLVLFFLKDYRRISIAYCALWLCVLPLVLENVFGPPNRPYGGLYNICIGNGGATKVFQ